MASEALLLVGLKYSWKCPVAYFSRDNYDADMYTSLVKSCYSTAEHGLRIWSVTGDGTSTNFSTFKMCFFS